MNSTDPSAGKGRQHFLCDRTRGRCSMARPASGSRILPHRQVRHRVCSRIPRIPASRHTYARARNRETAWFAPARVGEESVNASMTCKTDALASQARPGFGSRTMNMPCIGIEDLPILFAKVLPEPAPNWTAVAPAVIVQRLRSYGQRVHGAWFRRQGVVDQHEPLGHAVPSRSIVAPRMQH